MIDHIKAELEKCMGGIASVSLTESGLSFSVNCGPTVFAVGGTCGGTTIGFIPKGKLFPDMTSGRNPWGCGKWMELLERIPGWF